MVQIPGLVHTLFWKATKGACPGKIGEQWSPMGISAFVSRIMEGPFVRSVSWSDWRMGLGQNRRPGKPTDIGLFKTHQSLSWCPWCILICAHLVHQFLWFHTVYSANLPIEGVLVLVLVLVRAADQLWSTSVSLTRKDQRFCRHCGTWDLAAAPGFGKHWLICWQIVNNADMIMGYQQQDSQHMLTWAWSERLFDYSCELWNLAVNGRFECHYLKYPRPAHGVGVVAAGSLNIDERWRKRQRSWDLKKIWGFHKWGYP